MDIKKLKEIFNMNTVDNNLVLPNSDLKKENSFDDLNDDQRIDEIKNQALKSYTEIFERGLMCNPNVAGQFLESASKHLDIALQAEELKIKKKLENKKIKIMKEKVNLLKKKINLEEKNSGIFLEENRDGIYVERNELLKKLLNK